MSPEQEALLCVFCRKHPVEAQWRPFCSERCKLQDLANWADGTYRVAAEPVNPAAGNDADNTDTSEV
ncbi:MAG: DNA gyrase inhibitor YacG [Vicinamibacterales bacterium]